LRIKVKVEALWVSKRHLDFPAGRATSKVPRAEGDARIQQRIRVVWAGGDVEPQLSDGIDGCEVMGFQPLAVRVTDECISHRDRR
jgi:hypothetical protein